MKSEERFQDYFGVLTMSEEVLNKLEYILINNRDNNGEGYVFNLTEFLEENQGRNVGLVIANRYRNDIFNEVGKVEIINSVMMVSGRDISSVLWNKVKWRDKYHLLRILIDTNPDSENMGVES